MPTLMDPAWTTDIERGPDWIFLRLHAPAKTAGDGANMADVVWHTMQQHSAKRVVLELNELKLLHSRVIGQLVTLHKRICANGGTLRVCGLNDANQAAMHATRLHDLLPCYRDRTEAVTGSQRPPQPR